MDAVTMKWLITVVVWGALFFLMMRYGCGAHMLRGHRGRGTHDRSTHDVKDPVCGMSVHASGSSAAAVHHGTTYYFCSHGCRDKFEASPDKYATATSGGPRHG